ncbi:MAG: S41 family peptidase [Fimbriimonadales bacterium]
MKRSLLLIALVPVFAFSQLEAPKPKEIVGPRNLALSPDGSRLAFTYRGDVWVAPTSGGRAVPVTDNVEMDDYAVWSPDGQWIAFASNRNGNNDIYVVPAEGGESRRLTWFSGNDTPKGFTPDGKQIIFSSTRDKAYNGVYLLDVKSLKIQEAFLDMMSVSNPSVSPDGKEILYNRLNIFPWNRPRYQGSGAAQLWRFDRSTGKRIQIRSNGFQHLWPQWSGEGNAVYTVTVGEKTPSSSYIDKPIPKNVDNVARTPNVYKVGLDGGAKRLTSFVGGSGARFLTAAKDLLAFERDGKAYTLVPGQEPKAVSLTASLDDKQAAEERLIMDTGAAEMAMSPKADKVAFQIRGELWLIPTKKGKGPNANDAVQLTDWAGTDEQPLWNPDNKNLFFVSDRDGAERIYSMDTETKAVKPITTADYDCFGLKLTPDRKKLSYWMAGPQGGLFTIDIAGGTPTRILERPYGDDYAWSPDGRYLAYVRPIMNSGFNFWDNGSSLWVKDLQGTANQNVTNLNFDHGNPAWSADGKYLYFASTREGGGVFALPVRAEDARAVELELKFEKTTPKIDFDFMDTENRIRKLAGAPGRTRIVADPVNGDVYYNVGGDLWKVGYNGEDGRGITGGGGIGGFELSEDNNLLWFTKGGVLSSVNLRDGRFTPASYAFRADWLRNVRAERLAAFNECWRVYNRTFYDPNFHGRDWAEIKTRYQPLLDSVGHRNEMATVLNMMIGELESSHSEVGPAPGNPRGQSTAHLGFTIDYSYQGPGLKIAEVPDRTPGSYAKTRLGAGEYVVAVNGVDVNPDENLSKLLNEQAGRDLTLLVNKTPSRTGAREVKYRALGNGEIGGIEYRNQIDKRRKYVEQKSGGKLTYIHIAGMGGGNLETFNREAWQYIQGKEGVIIDVRGNGGGNIADVLLDMIERKPQMRYLPRDGEEQSAPGTVWNRPTVVMHNETSFSNAEMFPAAMKSRKLGTLVGMPTPGYVIYTGGSRLIDGTSIRIPGTGVYRLDGSPTENMGQEPDYRVDITPEQFFRGEDPQLDKAIDVLLRQTKGE